MFLCLKNVQEIKKTCENVKKRDKNEKSKDTFYVNGENLK